MRQTIRLAHSTAADSREAAHQFHLSVTQPDMVLVIFYCSNEYDLDVLTTEMNRLFEGVEVVGCTTAGEIGPGGYREHSLAGVSFASDACAAVSSHLDNLQRFNISEGQAFCKKLSHELEERVPRTSAPNTFALLLIDGLSVREEPVVRVFQSALGKIPLVGGSAADGLRFGKTYVFADGSFRSDSAVLTLVSTPLPFKVFKTQHFVPTDERLVITEADTDTRTVIEINGLPATTEYARLLGVDVQDVNPARFAASPLVVLIDGQNYVRSIQKLNADGSMTFFCAIEEGLVLRVARGVNLVENLEQAFDGIAGEIGPPQLILSYDCILRRLEVVHNCLEDRVGRIFQSNNAVGFNTYGEQFRGVHINQTLCGVAIGAMSSDVENA
jgi:hypothetical protein